MKINDVTTVLLTGPCTDDPWLSVFKQSRTAAFVEVTTDVGVIGTGETYAGYFFPESVPLVVDYVRPILVNSELIKDSVDFDVTTLARRMRTCCGYWARTGLGAAVISGVEAALWDLKGKLLGVPVHQLLRTVEEVGSTAPASLPAYATGGPSPWPIDDLFAKADFYLGLGFDAFKIASGYLDSDTREERSTGGSVEAAVEMEAGKLEALRAHVGADVGILLDGHMGHRESDDRWDLETAAAVLEAIHPFDVFMFEEPLPYNDIMAYAELVRRSPIRVAGGEQLSSYDEFKTFFDHQALTIAQPDAAWLGIQDFVRVAELFARDAGFVAPHAWGAGAAVMQNVHAAFASDNSLIVELPPAAGPLHREVWGDSLVFEKGSVLRPDAPGLGVHLTDTIKETFPFRSGAEEFSSVPGKLMRS